MTVLGAWRRTVARMHECALPEVLTTAALREAVARSAVALRSDVRRAARGVYVGADGDPSDVDLRIAVAGTGLGDGVVVGGWAAAHLLEHRARPAGDDLTVFSGVRPGMDPWEWLPEPVLLCAPRRARVTRREGTRVFRSDLDDDERGWLDGVPVTSPARTAFDVARLWPEVAAVVALDRMLRLGLVDKASLGARARRRRGWRGIARFLRALELADGGAESPRETMMRLLWCDAGLPRPSANVVVRDAAGAFVGRVDLLDRRAGVVGEYDGEHHADAARRRSDAVRQERLEELGLVVVRANDPDVATAAGRTALGTRLRRAYRRAEQRGVPRRWRAEDGARPAPRPVTVERYRP